MHLTLWPRLQAASGLLRIYELEIASSEALYRIERNGVRIDAQALAAQTADKRIAEKIAKVAKELSDNEKKIDGELLAAQGKPQDVGGYYHPDDAKAYKAMRPSATLNKIIDSFA